MAMPALRGSYFSWLMSRFCLRSVLFLALLAGVGAKGDLVLLQQRAAGLPTKSLSKMRHNVKAISDQLMVQRKQDLKALRRLKASYDRNLTRQERKIATLASDNANMTSEIAALTRREKEMRAEANALMDRNEGTRAEMLRLRANMSTAVEYANSALEDADRLINVEDVKILEELDAADAKREAEKHQEAQLERILPGASSRPRKSAALLALGVERSSSAAWADVVAAIESAVKRAVPWFAIASSGRSPANATKPDAGAQNATTEDPREALQTLQKAVAELARAKKSAEVSLAQSFDKEYAQLTAQKLKLLESRSKLKKELAERKMRVHRLREALDRLMVVEAALKLQRGHAISYAKRVSETPRG
eukprot:TRINITY_DN56312_c0_g1_i1.p1 TRINITY_DN56312_c0_g1~~TRINITY_DN56312_c0_g1_i1.p1  ORF type:complete len:365 (-),score=95.91 TRINITY_DN56312_c0_g1_i1:68-1162(-)